MSCDLQYSRYGTTRRTNAREPTCRDVVDRPHHSAAILLVSYPAPSFRIIIADRPLYGGRYREALCLVVKCYKCLPYDNDVQQDGLFSVGHAFSLTVTINMVRLGSRKTS